jgi:hypothetical protein
MPLEKRNDGCLRRPVHASARPVGVCMLGPWPLRLPPQRLERSEPNHHPREAHMNIDPSSIPTPAAQQKWRILELLGHLCLYVRNEQGLFDRVRPGQVPVLYVFDDPLWKPLCERWIPVAERLPTGEDAIRCEAWCAAEQDDPAGPCIMMFHKSTWHSCEDTGCWEPGPVTHWRPRSKGPRS